MEYEFICSKCRSLFSIEKIVIGTKGRAMFDLVCPKKHSDKQYLNAYLIDEWMPSVARQLYLCPKCGLKLTDISRETDDKKTTLILNCPTHFKIKKVVSNDFWVKFVIYRKHVAERKKLARQPPRAPERPPTPSPAPSETTPSTSPFVRPGDTVRVAAFDPKTGYQGTQATVPEPAPPTPPTPSLTITLPPKPHLVAPQTLTPPPSKAETKKPLPAPEPSPASQPAPFSSDRIDTMDKAVDIISSESPATSEPPSPLATTSLAETLKTAGMQSKDLREDFKDLFGGTSPSPSPLTKPSEPVTKPIEQDLMQARPSQVAPPSLAEPPKPPISEPIKEYAVQPPKTPLDLSSFRCPICEEGIYSIQCPHCNETTYDIYQCQNCKRAIESITCENCGSQIQLIDI